MISSKYKFKTNHVTLKKSRDSIKLKKRTSNINQYQKINKKCFYVLKLSSR